MTTSCTCQWSPVNTTTIDPPYIVAIDPDCPIHAAHECLECGGAVVGQDEKLCWRCVQNYLQAFQEWRYWRDRYGEDYL